MAWAFSPPGFSIWQFVPYAIQCVSGPGFLEEGHQNAKKHIEALEMAPKYKSFFISRTVVYAQSVCPNSWKVREKYSSSQVLRCPPFVQRNFIGEKAVQLWIEGTEVRRERSPEGGRPVGSFCFSKLVSQNSTIVRAKGLLAVGVCDWQPIFFGCPRIGREIVRAS